MSDLHVICTCPVPDAYPFRCECLDLMILSPQMHTICRAEPLLINGQPRDYDRAARLAAWRRTRSLHLKANTHESGRHKPQSLSASAQTNRCCTTSKHSLRKSAARVAHGAIGLAKATTGVDAADRQTIEMRHERCQLCRHNDCGRCLKCGCWIALKIRIRSEHCPLGNW